MSHTMLAVADVEKSSAWFQRVLGWVSRHGGPHFEELSDREGRTQQLLHHLEAHEHPQLQGLGGLKLGLGLTIYVHHPELQFLHQQLISMNVKVIHPPRWNSLAHQHELCFEDPNGYVFTARHS